MRELLLRRYTFGAPRAHKPSLSLYALCFLLLVQGLAGAGTVSASLKLLPEGRELIIALLQGSWAANQVAKSRSAAAEHRLSSLRIDDERRFDRQYVIEAQWESLNSVQV